MGLFFFIIVIIGATGWLLWSANKFKADPKCKKCRGTGYTYRRGGVDGEYDNCECIK